MIENDGVLLFNDHTVEQLLDEKKTAALKHIRTSVTPTLLAEGAVEIVMKKYQLEQPGLGARIPIRADVRLANVPRRPAEAIIDCVRLGVAIDLTGSGHRLLRVQPKAGISHRVCGTPKGTTVELTRTIPRDTLGSLQDDAIKQVKSDIERLDSRLKQVWQECRHINDVLLDIVTSEVEGLASREAQDVATAEALSDLL